MRPIRTEQSATFVGGFKTVHVGLAGQRIVSFFYVVVRGHDPASIGVTSTQPPHGRTLTGKNPDRCPTPCNRTTETLTA